MLIYPVILILLLTASANAIGQKLIPAPTNVDDVKLIIVGVRHGSRNPYQFLRGDPNVGKWGLEGTGELINIGKQESYAVGKILRSRYANLISTDYNPKEVEAITSNTNRCQMTLQLILAGLFPPKGRSVWQGDMPWQPIPYKIDNPMLRMYSVKECQRQVDAYHQFKNDYAPGLLQRIEKDKDLMAYIAAHTGLNCTSLGDMADVADNIMDMKMLGLPLPEWVSKPTLAAYNETRMVDDILAFAEIRQIACANDKPCRTIMAGYWLNHIYEKLVGDPNNLKIVVYSAHMDTTLSLIKSLGYQIDAIPMSGGFIIELMENSEGQNSARFLYHQPDSVDPSLHPLFVAPLASDCGSAETNWTCSLSQVRQRFQQMTLIKNWKDACNIASCSKNI